MAALNTYTGRWWNAMTVICEDPGDTNMILYTINGGPQEVYKDGIEIPAAVSEGETIVIRAYNQSMIETSYDSPIATLTLTAVNPSTTDYKNAEWELVNSVSEVSEEGLYIIVSG